MRVAGRFVVQFVTCGSCVATRIGNLGTLRFNPEVSQLMGEYVEDDLRGVNSVDADRYCAP